MAIVKNNFRDSRLDGDFSPGSRGSISSDDDDDELPTTSSESESEGSDVSEFDSGMGSDEYDLSELGEAGSEFCQVGNQSCSIPLELYDLPDLSSVLSVDAWNNCLTEEERFALAEYLPDMDQETFSLTLKELFSGSNCHFGSPLVDFFNRLKGGLYEPRVALCRRGLNFVQRREHYHLVRKYQNSMVSRLVHIRDAWKNCVGYGIEERLRMLNIMRSRWPLSRDGDVGSETDSENEEPGDGFWNKRLDLGYQAVHTREGGMGLEPAKLRKENPKGLLKVAAPKASAKKKYNGAISRFPSSIKHGMETEARQPMSLLALPRQGQGRVSGFDLGTAPKTTNQMRGDDDDDDDDDGDDDDDDNDDDSEEQDYQMGVQRDWNAAYGSTRAKTNLLKSGSRKQEFLKGHGRDTKSGFAGEDHEGYVGLPPPLGSRNTNQKVTIASYDHRPLGTMKTTKFPDKGRMNPTKDRTQHQVLKEAQVDWSNQPLRRSKMQGSTSIDHPVKYDDWNIRDKKWKSGEEFKAGKSKIASSLKAKSHKTFPAQMGDSYFQSDRRAPQKKISSKYSQNEESDMEYLRGSAMFAQSEETESDSSDQVEDDDNIEPSVRKLGYPSGAMEARQSALVKSVYDPKKANRFAEKDKKTYARFHGGDASIDSPEVKPYSTKWKQKGKVSDPNYLHDFKLMKKGQVPHNLSEKLQKPSLKTYTTERKRKGIVDPDHSLLQSNYMRDHVSGILDEREEGLNENVQTRVNRSGNRGQVATQSVKADCHERPNMPLLGCTSVTKKRKGKVDTTFLDEPNEPVYVQSSPKKQMDDPSLMKKKGKKKPEVGTVPLAVATPDPIISERGIADMDAETRPQKKPFTLITPTVHTGFSFSIIHLLSAVRKAMITSHMEDTSGIGNPLEKIDGRQKLKKEEQNSALEVVNGTHALHSHENMDVDTSEHAGLKNLPALTVHEIVNQVRSNPGDPCILETQEPLQDLVRGALKIFSSKTAPLGAKGWKALVAYEKSNKSWSWVGPVSSSSSGNDNVEEETSSEAWGIPHKMLVKLVDAFANWLKSGQETLQQIGSLPAPPIMMLPNLDDKERFRDLRAQKSLTTISPSSDEVKAYFRREEFLRYSVPDRAFSYTAADGKKSIVAPLRRGGGKPTSKARDHFMLKPDRPPHVTILCLVRDAAARLPGSIGTRADVSTLIRDSQYIVEDVSDAQVNQVVSGAMDRLHYERDPCVLFDGERKLWLYLHRDREEEDFEDDGTSSTKKWKRQRKDITEHSDMGAVNDVSYHGTGDPAAGGSSAVYDLNPVINVDTAPIHVGEKTELFYNDLRPNVENIEPFIDSAQGNKSQANPVSWEVLGLNRLRENKMLCQENSTNEDFDDEAFSREKPVGLLSTSLL